MTTSAAIPPGRTVRTLLPASTRAPRQAIRAVLKSWGLASLTSDAELMTSELVANSAEYASGHPIGLTIRHYAEPGGQRGIHCEITGPHPALPGPQTPAP